tara:strand:- start:841 stop:2364 length:1524 start_codon:yes stop_codon:yes gene_type:complete
MLMMTTDDTKIDEKAIQIRRLKARQKLILRASRFPLSVARLWSPYCHRWDGLGKKSPRPRGCGRPMKMISPGIYRCEKCNITEARTSQIQAIKQIHEGKTCCLISGGNRAGKSSLGAQLSVAFAAGSSCQWVQDWMNINQIPKDMIQPEPGVSWAVSLSYSDALEYVRPKLDEFLPQNNTIRRKWKSQDRAMVTLPSGGQIRSLSADSGAAKFQGSAVNFIWMDEEPPKDVWEECMLRLVDKSGSSCITATPIKGLTWMFDVFVDNPIEGLTTCRISGLDNPYVPSDKLRQAVSHLSAAQQKTRLFGEFTAQSGLIYDNFDPNLHVIDPIPIKDHPEGSLYFESIDFGTKHPFVCLWVALLPSGYHGSDSCYYVFKELYWTNKTTIQSGRQILKMRDGLKIDMTIADPESKDGRLTLSREVGINTIAAPKHMGVVAGIEMCREIMTPNKEGKCRLLISKECKNLIREMKLYRWNDRTSQDKPIKKDDHALDALRYLIMQQTRFNRHR